METRVAYITIPRDKAVEFAKYLVETRVAACVNIVDIRSIYRWEGEIYDDEEALLIVKTSADRIGDLEKVLGEKHPYEVPEYIVFKPEHVLKKYGLWVEESTSLAGKE